MILYEDKTYVTNSDYPDTDFLGNADYVIPDGSELARKIFEYFPKYILITETDENGNVIVTDVERDTTYTEEDAKRDAEMLAIKQLRRITESKEKLAQWLADNPIQFTDGKFYSVTEEKQTLLNSNLASYERALNACVDYPLKWNATGETCVDWTYSELLTLSLAIAGYVAPKVAIQQAVEMQIKACTTLEECEAIMIDYN